MASAVDNRVATIVGFYPFVNKTTSPANSTVPTAWASGSTSADIAASSTFANGMDINIGSGETQEMARILSGGGTTTLTFVKPLRFSHAIGDVVIEQNALDIGTPEANGVKINIGGEALDVFTVISRFPFGTLPGFVDLGFNFQYPTLTVDGFAFATGIPRTSIFGSGTAAVQTGTTGPRLVTTNGSLFGAITGVNLKIVVRKNDGTFATIELYNLTFDPTGLTFTVSRGKLTTLPVKGLASSGVVDFTGTQFVPASTLSTFAADQGYIVGSLQGVQSFTDGTATTASAPVAANAYAIVLTSATGFAAGGFARIGNEVHLIDNIASTTLNLRTQVQGAYATSTPVVAQVASGYTDVIGGVTFQMQGSTKKLQSEFNRNTIGVQTLSTAVTINFSVGAFTATNLMDTLAIPASVYANNIVPLDNNIYTAVSKPVLFTGKTLNGRNFSVMGWQGALQIGGEMAFGQANDTLLPISYKPTTTQFWSNA